MSEYVYLVTATGVYDHGCAAVCSTQEAAMAVAESLAARSDGYHDLRVDEMKLGATLELGALRLDAEPYPRPSDPWRKRDEAEVLFVSWADQEREHGKRA